MFSRIRQFLISPSARYSVFLLVITGIVIGGLSVVGTIVTMNVTGSNRFCQVCHEMNVAVSEYQSSIHYANASGIQASCADCHLTHKYPAKLFAKASKIKDLWHHLLGSIDTPEKYEKKRLIMARIEWSHLQESDSETCRYCHVLENMTNQGLHAQHAHSRATHHNITCIACHIGVAHKLPEMALPEAAKPEEAGQSVRCSGCHSDIKKTLSPTHPAVTKAELTTCIACHPKVERQGKEKNNFNLFMHTSHKKQLPCKACHDVSDGLMRLLVNDVVHKERAVN